MRPKKYQLFLILFLVVLACIGCGQTNSPGAKSATTNYATKDATKDTTEDAPKATTETMTAQASAPEQKLYQVVRLVDGDTFKIHFNNQLESVRLIGVNTPEIHHPTKGVEPYGREAAAYAKKLLDGKSVKLVFDVQTRDRYGRLLAYVYLPDGRFLNAQLVQDGYAQVMTVPPNVRFADTFVTMEQQAREAGRGMWAKKKH